LLTSYPAADAEQRLLIRAGLRAVYDQCGQVALQGVTAPEPAPPEEWPVAPVGVRELLRQAFVLDLPELLIECAGPLREAGRRLPPALLPVALMVEDERARAALRPLLGQRGRWLSRFNPAWRWVTDDDALTGASPEEWQRRWEEGTLSERCAVLRALRASDPAEARAWLTAVLPGESAEPRGRLLATLAVGLSADDEPFLEQRLNDRSEAVRGVAAGLLAHLPDSALAQRLRQRAATLLTAEPAGVLRKRLRVTCQPPETLPPDWARDGIPKQAASGRGPRATWVEALLAGVPLSFWTERWQTTPETLLVAVRKDEFATAVVAGWTCAAAGFAATEAATAAWLLPLWHYWITGVGRQTASETVVSQVLMRPLLQAMPAALAESALLTWLEQWSTGPEAVRPFLAELPQPWSTAFALAVLKRLRQVLERADSQTSAWLNLLPVMATAIPPAGFAAALEPWRVADPDSAWHSQAIAGAVDQWRKIIGLRQRFHEEIAALPNPHYDGDQGKNQPNPAPLDKRTSADQ
jgi:hypothetical protein